MRDSVAIVTDVGEHDRLANEVLCSWRRALRCSEPNGPEVETIVTVPETMPCLGPGTRVITVNAELSPRERWRTAMSCAAQSSADVVVVLETCDLITEAFGDYVREVAATGRPSMLETLFGVHPRTQQAFEWHPDAGRRSARGPIGTGLAMPRAIAASMLDELWRDDDRPMPVQACEALCRAHSRVRFVRQNADAPLLVRVYDEPGIGPWHEIAYSPDAHAIAYEATVEHLAKVTPLARSDHWRIRRRRAFGRDVGDRLSLAMIALVRNEDELRQLDRALWSAAGTADRCVVLLDERSLPAADEVVHAWGGVSSRAPWRGFAGARNAADAMVDTPWAMCLDVDEVLVEAADIIETINRVDESGASGVGIEATAAIVASRGFPTALPQVRAYRPAEVSWRYPVHNELDGLRTLVRTSTLFEAFYVGTMAEKAARSIPMLLDAEVGDSENPRWAYYLSHTHRAVGNMEECLRWSERCVAIGGEQPQFARAWVDLVLSSLKLRGFEAANEIVERGLQHHRAYPDLWHLRMTMGAIGWVEASQSTRDYGRRDAASLRFLDALPDVARALGLPIAFVDNEAATPNIAGRG